MQDQTYLRQAHSHPPTRMKNAETVQILVAVIAVAHRSPPGTDNTDLIPVAQHMDLSFEQARHLSDLHPLIIA